MRHSFLSPTLAALVACAGVPPLRAQAAAIQAAPIPAITYQGRLMESGVAITGDRSFVFAILDSTGVEQWNSGAQTLAVTGGLYSAVLGSTGMPALPAALLGRTGLQLRVHISGLAMTPDVDIVPAFQALSAWNLAGPLAGDLTGTQSQTLLSSLQGFPLDLGTAPASGQALVYNGSKWTAAAVAGVAGPAGPSGPQGPAGPAGASGAQGLQGLPGAAGAQGQTGAAGAQGQPGVSPFTLSDGNAVFTTGALAVGSASPDPSAILDLGSTTKGFLAPRMSSSQRLAILLPATGLTVYDTTLNDLVEFNGTAWVTPGASASMPWLVPVAGFAASAPGSPAAGERRIATANWGIGPGNAANQIATWTGSAWSFAAPVLNQAVFAATPGNGYVYNGSAWAPFTATLAQMGASPAQVLAWNGSAWAPANPAVSSGGTVTGVTASAPLASSGGAAPNLTLGTVPVALGGTGATTAAAARTSLGLATVASSGSYLDLAGTPALGSAAALTAGTGAGNVLLLGSANKLPALDGSLLTNLNGSASDATGSTAGGTSTLAANTGSYNTAFGDQSMISNTTGTANSAFGTFTMVANLLGTANTAMGYGALTANTNSGYNVAIGPWALYYQDYANGGSSYYSWNVAIGADSLAFNKPTTAGNGAYNTGLGGNSLNSNTTGSNNIGIGYNGGFNLTTGNYNIDIGNPGVVAEAGVIRLGLAGQQTKAFIAGVTGVTPGGGATQTVVIDANGQLGSVAASSGVSAVTASAPLASSGGSTPNLTLGTVPVAQGGTGATTLTGYLKGNGTGAMTASASIPAGAITGLGSAALATAGTGAGNVLLLGSANQLPALDGSLLTNINGSLGSDGKGNTMGGLGALAQDTTGTSNAAFGEDALVSNTTGSVNAAFGPAALESNQNGYRNIAMGDAALMQSTNSSFNVALGPWALWSLAYDNGGTAYGSNNVAVGYSSLYYDNPSSPANGANNTALGNYSLNSNSTGSYNIGIGFQAGDNLTTGNYNIDIANTGVAAESGVLRLGSAGQQTRAFIAGISGVTTGLGNAVPVMIDGNGQLGTANSSIRFKEDVQDMGELTSRIYGLRPVTFRYKVQPGTVHVGLIAEEVDTVMPELVVRNNDGEIQTVAYQDLTPMLLNELQKEHRKGLDQGAELQRLETENTELKARLAKIEQKLGL